MRRGDSQRLQYLSNADTLSKSREDAEEEAKAKANLRDLGGASHSCQARKERTTQVQPTLNGNIEQQDEDISVQDFLTFNTPYIESPKQLSYITNAIGAGRRNFVLPSYYGSLSCFKSSIMNIDNTGRDTEMQRREFHRPNAMNRKVAQKWKDLIDREVKLEKRRRLQNDTMSFDRQYSGENNHKGSQLEWFESVERSVCEEYQLNDAQMRAFKLFIKPLN